MKRRLLLVPLAVLLLCVTLVACDGGDSGDQTDVGTPRSETLIVEFQSPTDTPGQFNPYMIGTQMGVGIHQLMVGQLWEIDTVGGTQFPEIAAEFPRSNADFTEHLIAIREGIYWNDGEPLTAHDVAFTFNMVMDSDHPDSGGWKDVIASVEATGDYEIKIVTTRPFPRLTDAYGVRIWGNGYRVVPKHIFETLDDFQTYQFEEAVFPGPYKVKEYDPMGAWILYELRDDWERSTTGVITGKEPAVKYVWFKVLGDEDARTMAIVNNEVDLLMEVTPERMEYLSGQNENIGAWYEDFPWATSDDPCSKGIAFSHAAPGPWGSADFRWGIALALNFDEVSMGIFDGIGRASPWPILTGVTAMQEDYVKPLLPWLEDFELDLGDGTTFKPWDSDYGTRMAELMRAQGRDIPSDRAFLDDMFGYGTWAYNPEAAEKLFIKAGLVKEGNDWFYDYDGDGSLEPFTINLTYLGPDTEIQAARGVTSTYDQLTKFGFNCTIEMQSSSVWDVNGSTGEFEIAGYWPTAYVTKDIYQDLSGWQNNLIAPLGERGAGQGTRWDNQEATDIIFEMSQVSPQDPRAYELAMEWFKIAIEDLPFIGFHSGVKFVPYNDAYWTNMPSAENPHNGPWWWWSCFKYIAVELEPAG